MNQGPWEPPSNTPFEIVVTTGPWQTEGETKAALDHIVEEIGLFNVYTEVKGYYTQRRLHQEEKEARIDYILSPRQKLVDQGWTYGPIGIEVKKPGEKVGPIIAQMLDYSRAIWSLPNGFNIYLSHIFLWHLEPQHNVTASIMAQHRLGTVCSGDRVRFHIASGEANMLRVFANGEVVVRDVQQGRRAGSR